MTYNRTDHSNDDQRLSTVIATCPRCGRTYRPTLRAVADGTWQRCPWCEPGDDDDNEPDAA